MLGEVTYPMNFTPAAISAVNYDLFVAAHIYVSFNQDVF